jgi:hypothetical protein
MRCFRVIIKRGGCVRVTTGGRCDDNAQKQDSGVGSLKFALDAYRRPNAVRVDRGLLRKIVRAEIGAWVREKAEGIGSAPDQSDEPSAAVRASAKSLPNAHSGTRRRPR